MAGAGAPSEKSSERRIFVYLAAFFLRRRYWLTLRRRPVPSRIKLAGSGLAVPVVIEKLTPSLEKARSGSKASVMSPLPDDI